MASAVQQDIQQAECTHTGRSECRSKTHESAISFACQCPEHKCSNRQGMLESKGHTRNNCPRMQTTICEEYDANKCPICPCNSCGLRSYKLQPSHLCHPEHVCTLYNGEERSEGHNNIICPRVEWPSFECTPNTQASGFRIFFFV